HWAGASSRQGPTARIRPPSTASAPERWVRMCWLIRCLLLAAWTIVRGALSLGHGPDRAAAAPTGLAATLVNVEALAEITGLTVGSQLVAQGRAAGTDRLAQHRAHAAYQARGIGAREAARRTPGPQARPEQRLARVDVADADHQLAVHQQLLDGDATPAGDAVEIVGIEGRRKGLGSETLEQRMRARLTARVEQAAEATRVVEAHCEPRIQHQIEVIVREARGS